MKPMLNDEKQNFMEDFSTRKSDYLKRKLNEEAVSEQEGQSIILSILSGLIKTCWESVDNLNSHIVQFNIAGATNVVPVIEEMISDTYIHIGQLEKLLESTVPGAEDITQGRDEVETSEIEAPVEASPEAPEEGEIEDPRDFPDDINIK